MEPELRIFALSDPHLSRSQDKPMDIFGPHWTDHLRRISTAWDEVVGEEDLVLVPGDISWAMRLGEAIPDLEEFAARPGLKLFTKGNHDLWWPKKKRQFTLAGLPNMIFLHGRTFRMGPLGIAATRAWTIPGDSWFTEHDGEIYEKELRFLDEALAELGDATIRLVMLHYPPFNNRLQPGGFVERIEKSGATHVIHGHLHGPGCGDATVRGEYNGVTYHLTSCDFIDFVPRLILDLPELSPGEWRVEPPPQPFPPGVALVGPVVPPRTRK